MTAERLRDNLALLGLSSKEIEVYLTILDHGTATVSRVVEDSEASQRHVYQMCERLHERGLVVLNDHVRPSVVRAFHQSPGGRVVHRFGMPTVFVRVASSPQNCFPSREE